MQGILALTQKKPIMNKFDEDLPVEILHHSAYPGHMFKLTKDAGGVAPFVCHGCNEPGDGPRYTSDDRGTRLHLHASCGLADEENHTTLEHHLFPGKKFVFRHKPPPPVEGTICDACGEPAHGFVYHCSQKNLDLHPCCASLQPTITIQGGGGHAFELCNKASHRCAFCGDKGRRSRFWAYRGHNGGSYVYLHVACVKEKAGQIWNEAYHDRVGSGGGIVQACRLAMEAAVLQSAPSRRSRIGRFEKIITTVAKIIVAVIFGNPIAMISALVGPAGFFRD